jgi:hypothetical protein
MALPLTVRVKLSSEAAEAISLTPVVVQELPIRDLVEHMLGVTGKDEARIRELLLRGSLVSGASRFRWAGWQQDAGSLCALLATFPDPDPSRPFAVAACVKVILRGGRSPIEIPRDAVSRKSLFQRQTFWEQLMQVLGEGAAVYAGYSYRERTDRYTRPVTAVDMERIRAAAESVKFSTLRDQIRATPFHTAEMHALRIG